MDFTKRLLFTTAALCAASQVQAVAITAESHIYFAETGDNITDTDTANTAPSTVETNVDIWGGEWGPYASSRGNTDATFFMNAGGYGNGYNADASYTFQDTFFNSATTAQNFSMSLDWHQGGLDVAHYDGFRAGTTDITLMAQILIDGSLAWSTSASINLTDGVFNNNITGDLGTRANGSFNSPEWYEIHWDATTFNIDIGVIDALTAFDFEYTVKLSASDTTTTGTNWSNGQFGDPFSFTGTPITQASFNGTEVGSGTVPVPGSLALLGLGLLAWRSARRA